MTWYRETGTEPDGGYFDNPSNHFLAYRFDGTETKDPAASIYIGFNAWRDKVQATLPPNLPGKAWFRVADTDSFFETENNIREAGKEDRLVDPTYGINGRSILLLIER